MILYQRKMYRIIMLLHVCCGFVLNNMNGRRLESSSIKSVAVPMQEVKIKLSREEESNLSNDIRALREALKVREEFGVRSDEEWANAIGISTVQLRRIVVEGQEARSELVAKNMGLVVQISRRYKSRVRNLTLQDLIQEGNLGLMEASERFDPSKGFKFSTYAAWWVRQRILRYLQEHSRMIRLPAHVHSFLTKLEKTRDEMTTKIGRAPTMPELAHELDIPMDKLKLYTESSRNVLSLDLSANNNNDDNRVLEDKLASHELSPSEDAEISYLKQDIRATLDELSKKERDVLILRFGLEDSSPKTLEEVSSIMNMSRDRVRLLEARAINKLRHPGRNHKLQVYVDHSNSRDNDNEDLFSFEINHRTPEQIWSF